MENKPDTYFDETYDLLKKYTDDRMLLLKIQTAKKTSKITSKIIYIFIASILLFFVMMFLGLMLSYYFSEKMNSNFYGFTIVAGIYLFLFLLFTVLHRAWLSRKIMDMITNVFFETEPYDNNDEDDEDDEN